MDSENETRPLIHSFEQQSWRSSLKRKCYRIPSEVTVTVLILGLFLIVVTLVICLQNDDSSTSDPELTLDSPNDKLLASPFKYNKKALDTSWQEKKDAVKSKIKDHQNKWDNVDKGWKEFPYSGDIELSSSQERINQLLDSPAKYNKKTSDQVWKDKKKSGKSKTKDKKNKWDKGDKNGWRKVSDSGSTEISTGEGTTEESLLGLSYKYTKKDSDKSWKDKKKLVKELEKEMDEWYKEDVGWNNLLDSGWTKDEIKAALYEAWKETDHLQQSPSIFGSVNLKTLDESWKNLFNKGWKESEIVGALSEAWNEGKNVMLSAAASDNEDWKKIDNEWKKLFNKGWKGYHSKDAIDAAWVDRTRILRPERKFDNMKWKKVNNGWKKLFNRTGSIPSGCPFSNMQSNCLLGAPMPQSKTDCAQIAEDVRKTLGRCVDLSFLPKQCKPSWRAKCYTTYKYRKVDGTCNNKIHPTWGKSGIPYVRMIAPDYGDGSSSIRLSSDGNELPNSRLLSRKLYSKQMRPDSGATMLFLYFGLLIDHDMIQTAIDTNSIPCCDEKFEKHPEARPKACLQIEVSEDDPFYGPRNVRCLNLVRATPVRGECAGRREQLNQATSFLDASAVYGSTIPQAKRLRAFSKGQLRTEMINNTPYMAFSEGTGYACGTPSEPLKCFDAGDSRVNMFVELTAMHTLWFREHNRIAKELHKLNPQWTDETLFQEARRILIGELQHIVYEEFLPLLLGDEAMNEYELKIEENADYDGYDDTIDPSVLNVVAAAAFRFGHTLAQGMQELLGPDNTLEGYIALHETFFNPQLLYHNGLDPLIRGAAAQRTHSFDSYITPEVREHLFQPVGLDFGHDLAAVGIQRGRDHGLPPYVKWRSVCGLSDVNTWDDLYDVMDAERADALQQVYQSVEDIDLIPGALAENLVEGSLLGPTYRCLLGRQFKKTRKGDRFWFERQNEVGSFNKDQLEEIYHSNMARIVCDDSDSIKMIQRYPFKIPSEVNPVVSCDDIPRVDLSKWTVNT